MSSRETVGFGVEHITGRLDNVGGGGGAGRFLRIGVGLGLVLVHGLFPFDTTSIL